MSWFYEKCLHERMSCEMLGMRKFCLPTINELIVSQISEKCNWTFSTFWHNKAVAENVWQLPNKHFEGDLLSWGNSYEHFWNTLNAHLRIFSLCDATWWWWWCGNECDVNFSSFLLSWVKFFYLGTWGWKDF